MEQRENFFVLLRLSPDEASDRIIEGRISEKQREWAKQTGGGGRQSTEATQLLSLIPEIKRVMISDKAARAQEAAKARVIIAQKKKEAAKTLADAVTILKSKGYYTSDDVKQLVRQAAPLTEGEIRAELTKARLAEGKAKTGAGPRKRRSGLDPVTAGSIAADLKTLGRPDLYAYLGAQPRTSTETLKKAVEAKNRELMSKPHTPEFNTDRRLVGLAVSVFQSEEMRDKYDYTRSVAVLDDLKPRIRLANQGGFILPEAFEELVRQGVSLGVGEEIAHNFILDFAEDAKIQVVTVRNSTPSEPLLVCGSCFQIAGNAQQRNCAGCGEALYLDCPKCGKSVLSSDKACGACGARTGDYPLVREALRRVRAALATPDIDGASRLLQEAQSSLGDWPELAKARTEIEQRRREEEARKAQKREAQAARQQTIEALIRDRKLKNARKELPSGAKARGESAALVALDAQIAAALEVADKLFASAVAAEQKGDNETAAVFIEKALDACADFELAKQAAARLPPPPAPLGLNAEVHGKAVRLAWGKPASRRRLQYQIVRRTGRPARAPSDGEKVCVVNGTSREDEPAPGTAWHYAVFTRWVDSFSEPASAGPTLVREAVSGFSAVPRLGSVVLRWRLPAGATQVRVVRKKGAVPGSDSDGMTLSARGDGLTDDGLENEQTYGYRVTPYYPDPSRPGSVVEGIPATATAIPASPPRPVDDLRSSWEAPWLTLTWTQPSGGEMELRLLPKGGEPQYGSVLDAGEATHLGRVLLRSGTGRAKIELQEQGLFSLVPLSVRSGLATAGRAMALNTLRGVANVRVQANGDRIAVMWDWPPGFASATVRVATHRHEERLDAGFAETFHITKGEHLETGWLDFRPSQPGTLFITVFGRTEAGVDAPPVKATPYASMEARLSYRVELGGFLRASPRLVLRASQNADVPPLIVVAQRGAPPADKEDGKVILSLPPQVILQGTEAAFDIAKEFHGRGSYVKLFFASDADVSSGVRLMPDKDKLRLG